MTALQTDALTRNPNNIALTAIATYERLIPASLERVWENVLDWEHLPALHATSFSYVELAEAGSWGWRTWSNPEHSDHVELCVPDDTSVGGAYVARSYVGGQQVSEIWTTLEPVSDGTKVTVEFFATGVDPSRRERIGQAYLALYQQLWDEDEGMMVARSDRLLEQRSREARLDLGPVRDLKLPLTVQMMGQEYQVTGSEDALSVTPTICPHLLGPLQRAADGVLTCPWHNYRFDEATGACISPPDARCKLPRTPAACIDNGRLILRDETAQA